jgi:hypothetical protein
MSFVSRSRPLVAVLELFDRFRSSGVGGSGGADLIPEGRTLAGEVVDACPILEAVRRSPPRGGSIVERVDFPEAWQYGATVASRQP